MKHSFSNLWAAWRVFKLKLAQNKFMQEKRYVMSLPHFQKVAQIAATKKRLDMHRKSCEDAIAAKKIYDDARIARRNLQAA